MGTTSRKPVALAGLLVFCGLAAYGSEPAQPAPVTAAARLAAAEAQYGPDAAEVILPLIAVANATVAAGDAAAADQLLQRANRLLDRHPDHDRSVRLAVLVLEGENLSRQGRVTESNDVLVKALSLARSTTTIGLPEQADVLDRLAANEGRRGEVMRAGTFTRDALRLREKHYGKDSLEYAGALITAANWYRYSAQFERERVLEEEALRILEKKLGPRDPQLAIPLIRIATSYTAQRAYVEKAEQALQRAAALDYGATVQNVLNHAEVLASLADLRVVFGKPEDSSAWYTSAWQAIASNPQLGSPAANTYFGKVRRLYVATPDEIANVGGVAMGFTVTPVGTIDAARILANDVPNPEEAIQRGIKGDVGAAAWMALRRSRFRPRVIDGTPVATPDLSFSTEFCLEPGDDTPNCNKQADVSATR